MAPLASAPYQLDDMQADSVKPTKAGRRQTTTTANMLARSGDAVGESRVARGDHQVRRHSRHSSISMDGVDRARNSPSLAIESERRSAPDQEKVTSSEATTSESKSQSANEHKFTRLRRLAGAVNYCCCYANCLECARSIAQSVDKMHRLKDLIGSSKASRKATTTMMKNCKAQEQASDGVSDLKGGEQLGLATNDDQSNGGSAPDDCLKCRLIARWTASQADLVRERHTSELAHDAEHQLGRHQQTSSCSDSDRLAEHDCQLTISSPSSSGADSSADCRQEQAPERSLRQRRRTRRRMIAAEAIEPSAETSPRAEVARSAPKRPAPRPPVPFARHQLGAEENSNRNNSGAAATKKRLLSEPEVHSIEHSLKSHKSSLYVCGCLANLYFTKTHLAEGGRSSRASNDEWKLNQTGVPVLIFDSGLTKNRCKKRLSISLVERGSAFVLWSDTIDHLSGYSAYNVHLHSTQAAALPATELKRRERLTLEADNCDTFHVMYLSSNHRIMVGLSFDDPICARLFLAQIELVAADPSNIALTGPKLRKRPPARSKKTPPLAEQAPACTSGLATKLLQRDQSGGWSTLKRVAWRRFGTQTKSSTLSSLFNEPRSNTELAAVSEAAAESQFILTTFKPRPLPQLAATGKLWSSSGRPHSKQAAGSNSGGRLELKLKLTSRTRWPLRRQSSRRVLPLPRKCDISAPCLFQHVISVDLEALDKLYSRSYLLAKPPTLPAPTVSSQEAEAASEQITSDQRASEQISAHTQVGVQFTTAEPVAMDRPDIGREKPVSGKKTAKSLSLSSSSSCYSSASISPASSECGATSTSAAQHQRPDEYSKQASQMRPSAGQAGATVNVARSRGYVAAPRPPVAPPKPPQRGASWTPQRPHVRPESHTSEAPEVKISVLHTARPSHGRPKVLEGVAMGRDRPHETGNKIDSIIQELRAGASGELVEAKRRLMADIAGQVRLVARNRQQQQESGQPVKSKKERRHPSSSFKSATDLAAVSHL